MNVFHYSAQVEGIDGKTRKVYRVMAVETSLIKEAAELAKAQDPQYIPSMHENIDRDVLVTINGHVYGKTNKGYGEKVHVAHFRDKGGIDNGPVCGSGTIIYGFKRELTQRYTQEAVTCSKCLKFIKKLEGAK